MSNPKVDIKSLSGGLNTDDSYNKLPQEDYADALNITHDAIEGSNDKDITGIVANQIGDDTYIYPESVNRCIGAFANTLRNTVIQFIWNGLYKHSVLEYSFTTRKHTKIFENLTDSAGVDILDFTEEGKILSVDIYNREEGDLLFFLDSLGYPIEMDIELFKSGHYTPVTRDLISKAKMPPLLPLSAVYDNDTTRRSNNFRNKLFRFKYRHITDNFEKTTFSPVSAVPYPVNILSDIYTNVVTNNNTIRLSGTTGGRNVKSIEIAMSFVEKTNNWSDFQSVEVIDKSDLVLKQRTDIVVGDFSTVLFSYFSGIPSPDTVIEAYLTLLPGTDVLVGTYTVLTGDTVEDVATGIAASMVGIGIALTPFASGGIVVWAYYNATHVFKDIVITNSGSIQLKGV